MHVNERGFERHTCSFSTYCSLPPTDTRYTISDMLDNLMDNSWFTRNLPSLILVWSSTISILRSRVCRVEEHLYQMSQREQWIKDKVVNFVREDGWTYKRCADWSKTQGREMNEAAIGRMMRGMRKEPSEQSYLPRGLSPDDYHSVRTSQFC